MRVILAALVVALLIFLGAGLLPPLFAHGSLDQATLDAARAGSEALQGGGNSAAQAAALRSIATHPNMHIVKMGTVPGATVTFQVTVDEHIQTYLDNVSWLKTWFSLSSTQESTLGQ